MQEPSDQIQELLKEARAADKEDKQNADLFEAMIQTPAWKAYLEALGRRQQAYADVLLRPANGIDGCIRTEYIKGALSALVIARDLPSVTIQAAKELRQLEEIPNASA